jgi:hypothetical protein
VNLQGHRAQVAARNAALLVLAERGLTSAEIASLPGIALDERTIRQAIAKARQLREHWRGESPEAQAERSDPRVTPLFGCQPWERSKEELPPMGAGCPHCGKRIGPGDPSYCPRCAASGFDRRLARELGEAYRRLPHEAAAPRGRLHGRSAPACAANATATATAAAASAADPPRLSSAHRRELARTPQGYLWLKSIGQLPDDRSHPAGSRRKPS